MNNRIKELAEQAGRWCYDNYDIPTQERFQEKFAELIVGECIEVVKWTPSQFPNDEYVKNIKKHFGVEE
jgi:hypothetical protein